ncbi:MAG: MFS transporter [Mycobacterium sp.]
MTVHQPDQPGATRDLFASLLTLLLAIGWAASHFIALIPAISDHQHLTATVLDAVFAVYAVGILPGLVIGGRVSDALGRRWVAWVGSAVVLLGTVAMLLSQHSDMLLAGRLIIGVGTGFAVSSCTAWASDLKGPAGAAIAGAVLTLGFAIGPFASGAIAVAGESGIELSFVIAAALVVLATAVSVVAVQRARVAVPASTGSAKQQSSPARQASSTRALSWAMPLAPWVFASAALAFITIPARVHTGFAAAMAAGVAALIANGVSGGIQVLARARQWGPQAGTVGAVLAALGYALTAAAPPTMTPVLGLSLVILLGSAAGLCLREGLIDLEAAAPQRLRGTLTGAFYAVTYLGFGLPLLLAAVGPADSAMILVGLAALASVTAVSRAVRVRRDSHRQN